MPDYIVLRKSRNLFSSFVYLLLNCLLGIGSIIFTVITGSWIFGIILVILSKWRIFAVRPRFWGLNLKSNFVDLIVGVSFILLAYITGTTLLPGHAILASGYTFWLVIIKPRSDPLSTNVQSLFAIFLGITASSLFLANLNPVFLTGVSAFIGYAASRHVLVQSNEKSYLLLSIIFAIIFAEISLIFHYWNIFYIFNFGVAIPQLSLILSLISFLAGKIYYSSKNYPKTPPKLLLPIIFTLSSIIFIFFFFSKPIFNI